MSKVKKFQYKWHILIGICGVIIIIAWLSFLLKRITPIQTNVTQTEDFVPGSTSLITPTLLPSKNSDKNKFIHPQNHFSFDYPTTWNLELTRRNVSQPFYQVFLSNRDKTFRIYFSTDGRDYPNYEEITEYKNLGGRNIKWVTLYKNGFPVEAFTQFPDNDFGHNLIGLYIYLPQENQEQFIQQVEEIIASLK